MMEGIFLLLGTNLGDKLSYLEQARSLIELKAGTIKTTSGIYETAAWGKTDQPSFLNQVVEISTAHTPEILLKTLLNIENELGRKRFEKWGSRVIDIDLLYYNNDVIDGQDLRVPHPGIPDRRFTLVPLAEIAPDFLHPVLKVTQRQLLEQCEDPLEVKALNTSNL